MHLDWIIRGIMESFDRKEIIEIEGELISTVVFTLMKLSGKKRNLIPLLSSLFKKIL